MRNIIRWLDVEHGCIFFAILLQLFDTDLAGTINGFHFHKSAQARHLIKMKLDMPDKIDPSLFFHNYFYAVHLN